MTNPFRYFKTSPEIIRLAVMLYIRFPLSLRQVEDLLHERGIEVSHEAVRFWWNRFGPLFARELRKRRNIPKVHYSRWRWHLDEIFVRINGETHYLWRAMDHEGEILESFATKKRDRRAALTFLRKIIRRFGSPKEIVTDKLRSYGAAMKLLSVNILHRTDRWYNNRAENSHQPFRRREQAMLKFRCMKSLQKFPSIHAVTHNHFNQERHFFSRAIFKSKRNDALKQWRSVLAA